MAAFFDALGGKAAERWIDALFSPALLFWSAGLLAWLIHEGSWGESGQHIITWFDGLSGVEQGLAVAGGLLVITYSDHLIGELTLPALRLLEGYGLRRVTWLTAYEAWRLERAEREIEPLWEKRRHSNVSAKQRARLNTLAMFVRRFPDDRVLLMPTRLGNVIRAGERLPRAKYGLEGVICWPRLWLLLGEDVKTEVAEARRRLDRAVAGLIWSALIAIWIFLTWLVLVAVVAGIIFAYWVAVQRAKVFADLVEGTFDVHRDKLYDALRVAKPRKSSEEQALGESVTYYLWWGSADADLEFAANSTEQKR